MLLHEARDGEAVLRLGVRRDHRRARSGGHGPLGCVRRPAARTCPTTPGRQPTPARTSRVRPSRCSSITLAKAVPSPSATIWQAAWRISCRSSGAERELAEPRQRRLLRQRPFALLRRPRPACPPKTGRGARVPPDAGKLRSRARRLRPDREVQRLRSRSAKSAAPPRAAAARRPRPGAAVPPASAPPAVRAAPRPAPPRAAPPPRPGAAPEGRCPPPPAPPPPPRRRRRRQADVARASRQAVAAPRTAQALQQPGAGERLQHRLQPPPGRAQPLRHLRGAGQPAASAGVEGDVQGDRYGGQGSVLAQQQGWFSRHG